MRRTNEEVTMKLISVSNNYTGESFKMAQKSSRKIY